MGSLVVREPQIGDDTYGVQDERIRTKENDSAECQQPEFANANKTQSADPSAQKLKNGGNIDAAVVIGKRIAEKAKAAGVTTVAFDRSGYQYHGRIKALADAARENGLSF